MVYWMGFFMKNKKLGTWMIFISIISVVLVGSFLSGYFLFEDSSFIEELEEDSVVLVFGEKELSFGYVNDTNVNWILQEDVNATVLVSGKSGVIIDPLLLDETYLKDENYT